ncbi:MAG: hypothetical protein ACRDP8_16410 [Actinopolymorphaceae bacterium]
MSDQYDPPIQVWGAPPSPERQQPKPRHRKGTGRLAVAIYAGVVAGFLGIGAGASSAEPTTPVASEEPKAAPTVTVKAAPKPAETVEVPGPVKTQTVTKTKTVTKKVTPAACAKALDQGDRIVEAFQWVNGWTVDYLTAVSELDVVAMDELNGEIGGKSDEYAGIIPAYEALATVCRAAR